MNLLMSSRQRSQIRRKKQKQKQVLSASADHTLRLWSLNTGKQVKIMKAHRAAVVQFVLTPSAQRAVTDSNGLSAGSVGDGLYLDL